jgi:diguanylate cyclase (GGDEF)-like protein
MPSYPLKLRYLLPPALGFICLHAISLMAFRSHATAITYPFTLLPAFLALFISWRRVRFTSSSMRLPWIMFSVGVFLWIAGTLLSAWEELFQHITDTTAYYSDFVFFLGGAPVLLAISSPTQEQRIPLFVWLDGIQVILTAYLTYITLFDGAPFTTGSFHPISESLMMLAFNVENLLLACAATLRVLAQPKQGEERRFFLTLGGFLWIYAVCAGIYNYVSVVTDGHSTVDALVDVPFLFLVMAGLLPIARNEEIAHNAAKKPMTLFIENASPIFYTLALLLLGIVVVRSHFYLGISAIVAAITVYGIRTTVLQSRYLRSQQALQEARDRLEEISLKDGLTNIANRRCFDRMLEEEWKRAVRMQHSLGLLLIDIDFFKNLNDRHGHRSGDQCLIEIAGVLQSVLPRSGDLLARYGGEEFAVILPGTNLDGAQSVADRMRVAVRSLSIQNETSIGNFTTVSIGIAVYEFPQTGSPAVLVEASDRALYMAKQNGRNRIELSSMQAVFDAGFVD